MMGDYDPKHLLHLGPPMALLLATTVTEGAGRYHRCILYNEHPRRTSHA